MLMLKHCIPANRVPQDWSACALIHTNFSNYIDHIFNFANAKEDKRATIDSSLFVGQMQVYRGVPQKNESQQRI